MVAAAQRSGDHSAARYFEAMTDEQADQAFANIADLGRRLVDAFAPVAAEFAKATRAFSDNVLTAAAKAGYEAERERQRTEWPSWDEVIAEQGSDGDFARAWRSKASVYLRAASDAA